ncbi:MAG: phage virion morphogenesis protein [Azoarcus sp.]|nr:phage virion morphogenesis protein [Azoarcus sp.]
MDIRFSIADEEVLSALHRLAQSATPAKMRPVMNEIGVALTESTKRRFDTSTGPDGNPWPALEQSTLLARLSKASKKGATAAMNTKPLIETRELSTTIHHQIVNGGSAVDIGTNRKFDEGKNVGAEVHQFGTKNGRIPERPFLGLSESDKTSVLNSLTRFLEGQIRP